MNWSPRAGADRTAIRCTLPAHFGGLLILFSIAGMGCTEGDVKVSEHLYPGRRVAFSALADSMYIRALHWDSTFCDRSLAHFINDDLARSRPGLVASAFNSAFIGRNRFATDQLAALQDLAERADSERLRAWHMAFRSRLLLQENDLEAAMELGSRSLGEAQRFGDSTAVAYNCRTLGQLLTDYLAQPTAGLPYLRRYSRLAKEQDEKTYAAHLISQSFLLLDQLDSAREYLAYVEGTAPQADRARPQYPLHTMCGAMLRFGILAQEATGSDTTDLDELDQAFLAYTVLLRAHRTRTSWNALAPHVSYARVLMGHGQWTRAAAVLAVGRDVADSCWVCDDSKPDLHALLVDLHRHRGDLRAALYEQDQRIGAMRVNNMMAAQANVERAREATVYKEQQLASAMERERERHAAAALLQRQRTQRNVLLGFGAFGIVFAIVDYRRRRRIKEEHARSEALLLNILPRDVAEELKAKGHADAKHFDQVSILFTDFKGFTEASEKLSPQELVEELNTCFKAFDQIITARGIEKIKTIGDAYMCAAGLPDPKTSSPAAVVHAALEMQAFMTSRKSERDALGLAAFEMRVGIHTGPVVAGIVGVKKFQYDIWGDTVNTASRMESSGEVGQVNISEATYALVKNEVGLTFTPRGKVQAKGKGEMEMYFAARA